MRHVPSVLTLALGLALGTTACLTGGEAGGGGWVGPGAWEPGDVVRLAWTYESATTPGEERVRMRGAVPIEEGRFDLDLLTETGDDPEVPTRSCVVPWGGEDPPAEAEPVVAWGRLVATGPEIPEGDLEIPQAEAVTKALSWQHVAVWASGEVPRDSLDGQRFGSSLHAGTRIMRRAECRVHAPCQELCVEPIDDDALVILDGAMPP